MSELRHHTGGCHCGAIGLTFSSRKDPADLPVRECQCGFCRKHGTRAITDPEGQVTLRLNEPDRINRYTFGLMTAEYFICSRCGVYVAAVTRGDSPQTAIAILNTLDTRDEFTSPPLQPNYDAETLGERQARRAKGWTPARIERA